MLNSNLLVTCLFFEKNHLMSKVLRFSTVIVFDFNTFGKMLHLCVVGHQLHASQAR